MSDQNVQKQGARKQPATVAALRRKLAQMSEVSTGSTGGSTGGSPVLPVPGPVAELLPRGGLVPGSVAAVSGAMTLPVALLAAASAAGATAALVGLPQLNLAMAADLGADLSRIAVVPATSPGTGGSAVDLLEVAAVLLDGIDLVLVGIDRVTPSRARVLTGRARRQSSTLMAVGPSGMWPGAAVRMDAQVAGYRHLPLRRNGYGRIGGLQVDIGVAGTGIVPRGVRCELIAPGIGEDGPLRLVAATPHDTRLRVAN